MRPGWDRAIPNGRGWGIPSIRGRAVSWPRTRKSRSLPGEEQARKSGTGRSDSSAATLWRRPFSGLRDRRTLRQAGECGPKGLSPISPLWITFLYPTGGPPIPPGGTCSRRPPCFRRRWCPARWAPRGGSGSICPRRLSGAGTCGGLHTPGGVMQAIQRFRRILDAATGWSADPSSSYRRTTTSALWSWGLLLGWYLHTVVAGSQPARELSTTERMTPAPHGQVFERDSSRMRSAEPVLGRRRRRRGRIGRERRCGRKDKPPDHGDPGTRR